MDTKDRNKLIIPDGPLLEGKRRGCPACGHQDFSGRRVMGQVTFTCKNSECGNKWQGGLQQEPNDPHLPRPPENPKDKPPVAFEKDEKGEFKEVRRAVSTVPEFRKGAPVPSGEE